MKSGRETLIREWTSQREEPECPWHVTLAEHRRSRFANAASAVVLTWFSAWFLIVDEMNKLHLLWMLPLAFCLLEFIRPASEARSVSSPPRRVYRLW